MVFLTCDQVDDAYVNDTSPKVIAVVPFATTINGVLTLSSHTSAIFTKNYDRKLSFHLPVKRRLAHLKINDFLKISGQKVA